MWCQIKRECKARHTWDKQITTHPLDKHSLSETKSFNKFLEFDASKSFGETIGQLLICRDVFGSNCPIGKFFTNKVVVKLDVSRSLTMDLTFIFTLHFFFLFLEQLGLGSISHTVTSVTSDGIVTWLITGWSRRFRNKVMSYGMDNICWPHVILMVI